MAPKKIAGGVIVLIFAFFVTTQVTMRVLGAKIPEHRSPGENADALAHQVEAAIGAEAWAQTGAVSFTFRGKNHHLWDRKRQRARVISGETTALLDLASGRGIVEQKGQRMSPEAERSALAQAQRIFWNDTFWLNPLVKLFDEGVIRETVSLPDDEPSGTRGLYVTYTSGGVTPGDSYLWLIGPEGRPIAWRMWTSVFPIQGIRVTWDGWVKQPSGALIATTHHLPGVSIEITDLVTASDFADLVKGTDPLAALDTL
ncbi:MAG: hypothetical protein U1E65_05310 [Myxococcota bacterium]